VTATHSLRSTRGPLHASQVSPDLSCLPDCLAGWLEPPTWLAGATHLAACSALHCLPLRAHSRGLSHQPASSLHQPLITLPHLPPRPSSGRLQWAWTARRRRRPSGVSGSAGARRTRPTSQQGTTSAGPWRRHAHTTHPQTCAAGLPACVCACVAYQPLRPPPASQPASRAGAACPWDSCLASWEGAPSLLCA
jgi:hypothetical protein